jgi:hypothetical protein
MGRDPWKIRRIRVEVPRLVEARDMTLRVGKPEDLVRDVFRGCLPDP